MITALTLSQLYVLNQDEALDFYVGKLGMEVRKDFDLGFMRWLTIGVPGQPETEVLLELPERLDRAAWGRAVLELATRMVAASTPRERTPRNDERPP